MSLAMSAMSTDERGGHPPGHGLVLTTTEPRRRTGSASSRRARSAEAGGSETRPRSGSGSRRLFAGFGRRQNTSGSTVVAPISAAGATPASTEPGAASPPGRRRTGSARSSRSSHSSIRSEVPAAGPPSTASAAATGLDQHDPGSPHPPRRRVGSAGRPPAVPAPAAAAAAATSEPAGVAKVGEPLTSETEELRRQLRQALARANELELCALWGPRTTHDEKIALLEAELAKLRPFDAPGGGITAGGGAGAGSTPGSGPFGGTVQAQANYIQELEKDLRAQKEATKTMREKLLRKIKTLKDSMMDEKAAASVKIMKLRENLANAKAANAELRQALGSAASATSATAAATPAPVTESSAGAEHSNDLVLSLSSQIEDLDAVWLEKAGEVQELRAENRRLKKRLSAAAASAE